MSTCLNQRQGKWIVTRKLPIKAYQIIKPELCIAIGSQMYFWYRTSNKMCIFPSHLSKKLREMLVRVIYSVQC